MTNNTTVMSVLLYNAIIIGIMTFLFIHFENGWPTLMVFLLAHFSTKDDDQLQKNIKNREFNLNENA